MFIIVLLGFSQKQCEEQKSILQAKMSALEDHAYQLAGHTFSLTSTDDIAQVNKASYCVFSGLPDAKMCSRNNVKTLYLAFKCSTYTPKRIS